MNCLNSVVKLVLILQLYPGGEKNHKNLGVSNYFTVSFKFLIPFKENEKERV